MNNEFFFIVFSLDASLKIVLSKILVVFSYIS